MKKQLFFIAFCMITMMAHAQWKPVGEKLKTAWAEEVHPEKVLPEYPRPLMQRAQWLNLNGLWKYAIRAKGGVEPSTFDGEILVPFAVESSLSGVQKRVTEKEELWYKRSFSIPNGWKGKQIKLHFGAVDWRTDVFVNDLFIGSHEGGYDPFSFNITPFLNKGGEQTIVVRVWDPTNKGYQPIGKQSLDPNGIWYTAVTGIWQTVWIEPVSVNHLISIKAIPNIDQEVVEVTAMTAKRHRHDVVEVTLFDQGVFVGRAKGIAGKALRIAVPEPKLWSPETPTLYDMKVALLSDGKIVDEVDSYAAMRKIAAVRDADGIMRMQLNNRNYFHLGTLDQGWWPDGLYTAPTDEALLFDIEKTKALGFNMIRKHVKVEPARWYYHCDREGMLVWQDMPSGDIGGYNWDQKEYNGGADKKRTERSKENYYQEWQAIMDLCMSHPSVVVWVPFNEAWGQFDTEVVAEWTKQQDPSRLVNSASGGNFRACGDILDIHHYPQPAMFLFDPQRVNVLGEYGGIGLALEGHLWWDKRNWGYVQFKEKGGVTGEYVKYAEELRLFLKRGFSAAVYTQTTDVEGEVNGLMTYDRKELKVDEEAVRAANQAVINELK